MAVKRSRWTPVVGGIGALFLIASVAAAAGAGFTATNSMGAGQRAVTSPCSSVTATVVPTYDEAGFYRVAGVEVALTCAPGNYSVRVTLAAGSEYVERSGSALFAAQGSQTIAIPFSTVVKVEDLTNIAALVVPAGS